MIARLLHSFPRIALALAFVFAAAGVVLWAVQDRLVFVPPPTPVEQGRGATRIEFVSRGFDLRAGPHRRSGPGGARL